MTEVSIQHAAIETGVFDLSRLPVQWSSIDPDKAQTAFATIEATVTEQIEQLKETQKIQCK